MAATSPAGSFRDAAFHPFWAKAEELGAVVFIHPQASASAELSARLKGNGMLGNVIGNPLGPRSRSRTLIFEEARSTVPGRENPSARPTAAVYLPSYMSRSDHTALHHVSRAVHDRRPETRAHGVREADAHGSLVFTPEALRHLVAEVGASHVVMGADHPYPWVSAPVDHVLDTPGTLTDRDREEAIPGRTGTKSRRFAC